MIFVTDAISIDASEIREEFIHASGPGGQNVNKVATAVQLRWDVINSSSLPADVRGRLIRLAGKRITAEGVLIINARRYRKRERNRMDAIERLVKLVRRASEKPPARRPTHPSAASVRRRLEAKGRRRETKRLRQSVTLSED